MRLVHKMAILLVLPACVQTILVGVLISLEAKAESSAALAQQQSQAIKIIDEILFDFGLTIGSVFTSIVGPGTHPETAVLTPDDVSSKFKIMKGKSGRQVIDSEDYHKKMNSRLADLRRVCTSETERELVNRAASMIDRQYYALKELDDEPIVLENNGAPPLTLLHKMKSLRQSVKGMYTFFENFRALLHYNNQRQEMYLLEEKVQRLLVRNYIIIVLGLQSIISLAIIAWFSQTTTKRLRKLLTNASSMHSLKELPNKLDGFDELAQIDETLHRALNELKTAVSLKNNLLNMLAHDVRSPVALASLILSNLSAEENLKDTQSKEFKRLKNLFKTIGSLIDDLLTFQKGDASGLELTFSEFSMSELMSEIIQELEPSGLPRGIRIALEAHENSIIIADRSKIGQVLRNLLSNAIKFSPEESLVQAQCVHGDSFLKVSVRDSGRGISAEDATRIFEQFSQVQEAISELGFGLGLHICKMLIELHGGRIGLNSQPGQGSEFWFELPIDVD